MKAKAKRVQYNGVAQLVERLSPKQVVVGIQIPVMFNVRVLPPLPRGRARVGERGLSVKQAQMLSEFESHRPHHVDMLKQVDSRD